MVGASHNYSRQAASNCPPFGALHSSSLRQARCKPYSAGMALFRRKPLMEKLENELAALRARAETLTVRHAAAKTAYSEAKSRLQAHLLEGDLDADEKLRAKLEAAVTGCAVTRDNLAEAITLQQVKVAEIEYKIAAERAAVERNAAADKLAYALEKIERAAADHANSARLFAEALETVSHHHFDSAQMGAFLRNTQAQLEVASALSVQELRRTVEQIKNGTEPIPRHPGAVQPSPVEQLAPMVTVFMLKSARYRDETGRKRFLGQWDDAILPQEIAAHALRLNVAVPTTDPRRAQLRGTRNGDYASDSSDVVDLDAAGTSAQTSRIGIDPVLEQAGFQEIDRSAEQRMLSVPISRV
jgi:hypothetical protein